MDMGDTRCMLLGMENMFYDLIQTKPVFDLRKDERTTPAHFQRVAFHHAEIGTHQRGQVGFVYDEQIRLRNSRAPFARDFVAPGHVNDVNGEISQLAAEVCRQVVSTGFEQQQFGMAISLELL